MVDRKPKTQQRGHCQCCGGEWQASPNDTVGFIYEARMPSGTRLLLGDQRALDRLPAQYSGSPIDGATESPESGPR